MTILNERRMSMRNEMEKFLALTGEPQTTQQLLAMLRQNGFQSHWKTQHSAYAAVFISLKKDSQRRLGSIVKLGTAFWGLKEWLSDGTKNLSPPARPHVVKVARSVGAHREGSMRHLVEKYLRFKGEPQTTQQLLRMLNQSGFQIRRKEPIQFFYDTVSRFKGKKGSIVRVGTALWGLKEWQSVTGKDLSV